MVGSGNSGFIIFWRVLFGSNKNDIIGGFSIINCSGSGIF